MAKQTVKSRQIVGLCDDLLRLERGKLAKLMSQKDQLQSDRARVGEVIDGAKMLNSRLIEMCVERLSSIDKQLYKLGMQIDAQRAQVSEAAIRSKVAEASLRSAKLREAMDQRRMDETEMVERVAWEWLDKAPIR